MKKICLLLMVALLIAGCGGGGGGGTPTTTSASGYMVDQNDAGVGGVEVSLGSMQATTSADGRFTFSSLDPGTYQLSGAGGTSGHYLAAPGSCTIDEGTNDLGRITAYRLIGCGVIVQSLKDKSVRGKAKEIDPRALAPSPGGRDLHPASTRQANDDTLNDNISFIYLNWDPIDAPSVTHYVIDYLGDTTSQVWDSDTAPADEKLFDEDGNCQAYLDLGDELGFIDTAGYYSFRITAMNGTEEAVRLPDITVSLGMTLETFPAGISYAQPEHTLSWTGVENAGGYRVQIYDEEDLTQLADSGDNLLEATSYDLSGSGLTGGVYYYARVDAHVMDGTGWTAEITRGISGFSY